MVLGGLGGSWRPGPKSDKSDPFLGGILGPPRGPPARRFLYFFEIRSDQIRSDLDEIIRATSGSGGGGRGLPAMKGWVSPWPRNPTLFARRLLGFRVPTDFLSIFFRIVFSMLFLNRFFFDLEALLAPQNRPKIDQKSIPRCSPFFIPSWIDFLSNFLPNFDPLGTQKC